MKINIHPQDKISFEQFCEKYQLSIDVCERNIRKHGFEESMRWYATLKDVYIKDHINDSTIGGCHSNGATPDDAIKALPRKLEGKVLVLNASEKNRKNIPIPYFTDENSTSIYEEIMSVMRRRSQMSFEYINPNFLNELISLLDVYGNLDDENVNKWALSMFGA